MNRDTDDKTTDAEGHMPIKRGSSTEAGDDGTEGHMPRIRLVDEAGTEDVEDADAEGHANPPGRPHRK